ncbi:glycosyltransferase [Sulfuricurvum sp.]|uniref:glycosyltransferase family protein n=1 Tax=Sulfuricurvum sp. TaxID=2025608 RepID=UPI00356AA833
MKRVVLIIDVDRPRSPLLTQFQDYLCNNEFKDFIFYKDSHTDLPLEDIVAMRLNGNPPDILFTGFIPGYFVNHNAKYIQNNNIRLIICSADNWLFGQQDNVRGCSEVTVDAIITRTSDGLDVVKEYKEQHWNMKDAKIIHVPWGIDETKYESSNLKFIDVSFISSISPGHFMHEDKQKAFQIVKKLTDCFVHTENVFGETYIDILKQTKIFIVAGSAYKGTLTQKYLEGAASGCLLIGEIPFGSKNIFANGKSIVEVTPDSYDKIPELVNYYLSHEPEREYIADQGKRNVIKHLGIQKVVSDFVSDMARIMKPITKEPIPERPQPVQPPTVSKPGMTILILCNDNTANNLFNLTYTIRNYFPQHKVTMIQCKENYLNYPKGDYMARQLTRKQFLDMLREADYVFLNECLTDFRYPTEGLFADGTMIDLRLELSSRQKVIRHSNGTYARKFHKSLNPSCREYNILQTASTPDLNEILSGSLWLPQPIPLYRDSYDFKPPKYKKNGPILISHSPTNRLIKSTDHFLQVVDEVKEIYPEIELDLISNTTHVDCMARRRKCHIHFDQLMLGAYGVASLEALAMGQICIVGLEKVEGYIPGHSFINTPTESSLKAGLIEAIELLQSNEYKKHLKAGREWVENTHDARKIVEYVLLLFRRMGYFGSR